MSDRIKTNYTDQILRAYQCVGGRGVWVTEKIFGLLIDLDNGFGKRPDSACCGEALILSIAGLLEQLPTSLAKLICRQVCAPLPPRLAAKFISPEITTRLGEVWQGQVTTTRYTRPYELLAKLLHDGLIAPRVRVGEYYVNPLGRYKITGWTKLRPENVSWPENSPVYLEGLKVRVLTPPGQQHQVLEIQWVPRKGLSKQDVRDVGRVILATLEG